MPDRDEQATKDSELQRLEEDARRSDDVPPGSNPSSPQHQKAAENLKQAEENAAEQD